MPVATVNGIEVQYELHGSGPPLLMFAAGGFDARIDRWLNAGVWAHMDTFNTLGKHFTCIAYDRRESGQSGGRIEPLTWAMYAAEAKGLLDELGYEKAFVLGGCMGCSVASAFGTRYPEQTMGLLMHWPVGGYEWKIRCRRRFDEHHAYVRKDGLAGVAAAAHEKPGFWADPRGGLWSSVVAHDADFEKQFLAQDVDRYLSISEVSGRALFDRDTHPGAEPEEIAALKVPMLIIPGDDPNHAQSAAHYLRELVPHAEYWPCALADQHAPVVAEQLIAFGRKHS